MVKKLIALLSTLLFLLSMTAAASASDARTSTSLEQEAGSTAFEYEAEMAAVAVEGGYNIPVVIPGANIIVTFTLENDGGIPNLTVTGAPEGASLSSTEHGVRIEYMEGGTAVALEVEAEVEMREGVVKSVSFKVEYEADNEEADADNQEADNAEDVDEEDVDNADDADEEDVDNEEANDADDADEDDQDAEADHDLAAPVTDQNGGQLAPSPNDAVDEPAKDYADENDAHSQDELDEEAPDEE